jgi:RNA polymerase sigma factor (sigma-70 family)
MPAATMPDAAFEARFAALLAAHRERMLAFLRRLAGPGDDAEDLLQETLAKVWRLRMSFDPAGNAAGWLLQAAFRTFCDQRTRRRGGASAAEPDALPGPSMPCRLELRDEVNRVLSRLSPLERELMLGFHRDGLSLGDLATKHGLPINTVKSHLHRARQRLARPEEP